MLQEEKLCLIAFMLKIKKITTWNVYLLRYLKDFIQDQALVNEKPQLLDLTYKIVTNKVILQYVKASTPSFDTDKYIDIVNEMINIYLMSIEDIRTNNNN